MEFLLITFFCLATIIALPANAQLSVASIPISPAIKFQQEVEAYIESVIAKDAPGLAITVVVDGKTILTKGYGISKMGSKDKINPDTVFRLASVSKSLASAAIGSLVQNNKLQWNSKITEYLDFIRFKNPQYTQALTIQDLLSHRTGLVPHAYTNLIEDNVGYKKILKKFDEVAFVCAPATCYGYQNVVFSLVGDIIEVVSNDTFENFVSQNLFDPLNMKNASYGIDKFINSNNRANPHVRNKKNKQWVPITVNENYYKIAPAAGANASIQDMNHWLLAQLGHYQNVINNTTLGILHKKHVKTTVNQAHYRKGNWQKLEGTFYGLGWRVFDYGGRQNYVHHGGYVKGTRAEVLFHTDLQMGVVFLTNSETKYASEVVPTFLQLYSKHILNE
ncbi:MAG: serine hydrolase domain-containing protein [Gammaproteobacteria bacterium]|jgi:beta-lactamase class C